MREYLEKHPPSGYQSRALQQAGAQQQGVGIGIAPHEAPVELRRVFAVALRQDVFAKSPARLRTENTFVAKARERIGPALPPTCTSSSRRHIRPDWRTGA